VILRAFRGLFRLPPAASTFAPGVDGLHLFVIATTFLGIGLLSLVVAYFLLRYGERSPRAVTPVVRASVLRETLIIGGTLGLFLVWWVIGYRQYLHMRQRPADALPVYAIAKQWMWKFSYADGHVSNDVLTIPVNRPVELVMTSRDVIHSFYVPAMRVKQDVLPGRYVTVWFEPTLVGNFQLFCAEYCGVGHSRMLGEVHVLSENDYRRFEADSNRGATLAEIGQAAATRHGCFACHTVDGQTHIGPTWSKLYGSDVTLDDGQHVLADPAYLTESMMDPAARVVAGYRPVMPTYQGQLDAAETAAIVEYIRSLRDAPIAKATQLPPLDYNAAPAAMPDRPGVTP